MDISLIMTSVACLASILCGRPLIRLLKHWRIGKQIRIEGPSSHQVKTGTPTMGGIMFIAPVLVMISAMYLYTRVAARVGFNFGGVVLVGKSLVVPMTVMLLYAILGAIDDYMGVRGVRRGEGMRGRTKAIIQVVIALIAAVVMNLYLGISRMGVPGLAVPIELGLLWIPIAVFIIVGVTNAVNFADGLDGLAALISVVMYVAYGVIGYLQGQVFLTMFCMVTVGALLGFLWFNVHPAALFMGDTGSEALGGALGVVALMTGQWLLLPIIAIIPVAEVLSVMLQVGYFKLTKGKRLFKMAPIHHHFELLGWSETQVVQRFWLIAILSGLVGVGMALFGNR
ncbi:MAG: phospho-N-acetylmuramoyl-pentapeptide-transferase [Chloroflexi bacterium]|nr:phospho-N-acetylmuramoyl-pentapeptide-transferase [Chloroflexota bacterium]MCL5274229.1 phospho-N-acetylmuramoyl-pentapeptide-transferase [Chloroflexota bacterium]